MKKIYAKITGIHCKSCKTFIEEEVKLLTGVREIKVNQNTGGAEIVYDEKEISLGEIKREIEALNYEVKIIKK